MPTAPVPSSSPRRAPARPSVKLRSPDGARPISPGSTNRGQVGTSELASLQKNPQATDSFWKWVGIAAIFHLLLFVFIGFVYFSAIFQPKSVELPNNTWVDPGDLIKGSAKPAASPPALNRAAAPPASSQVTAPETSQPAVTTMPKQSKAIPVPNPTPVRESSTEIAQALVPIRTGLLPPKDVTSHLQSELSHVSVPVRHHPFPTHRPHPAVVHVQVDLSHEVERTDSATDQSAPPKKPKKVKHTVEKLNAADPSDSSNETAAPDLSSQEIAERLSQELQQAGVTTAQTVSTQPSGSHEGHSGRFSAFYTQIRDRALQVWNTPNLADPQATSPVVQIHIDPDGTVNGDRSIILQSSGNTNYDQAALEAARKMGTLPQALPKGCPADIPLTFKITEP